MSARKTKTPPPPPPCKGFSFHVFTLGADRCSCCGWNRYRAGGSL